MTLVVRCVTLVRQTALGADGREMVQLFMTEQIYRWRGLDPPSLEVLRLQQTAGGISAHATLSVNVDPSYAVSYEWQLDENWCTVWKVKQNATC